MAKTARAHVTVPLDPPAAERLWTDTRRWAAFVEGFGNLAEVSPDWPEPGSKAVWTSIPGGRGRVTEKVLEREPGRRIVSEVFEERMAGRQTVTFHAHGEETAVEVELEYELSEHGFIALVAGLFFVRRAIRDSLGRTLRRYAVEAAEEATYE